MLKGTKVRSKVYSVTMQLDKPMHFLFVYVLTYHFYSVRDLL